MANYFQKLFFAMLVCFSHTQLSILGFITPSESSHVKCIEKERQSLLNFKQGLIDEYGMVSTWTNNDCCKWKGIECNNQTGHVQMLHLRGHDTQRLKGTINLTSLIALQKIQHLDLSNNDFEGSHIPKFISSFSHLRYLNLSYSSFGGTIPYELGNLSQLEYLDLSKNYLFHGEIPSQLGKLTSLIYLDLSGSFDIYGEIPHQLGNLSQLRYLGVWQTSLSGVIPFQVGNLPLLHTLSLVGNFNLNFAKWLSSLSSLTTLSLSSSNNHEPSHQWLHVISEHLPKLRELRLVGCSLSDIDISSLFPSGSNYFNSLSILDLSWNLLTSTTFLLVF